VLEAVQAQTHGCVTCSTLSNVLTHYCRALRSNNQRLAGARLCCCCCILGAAAVVACCCWVCVRLLWCWEGQALLRFNVLRGLLQETGGRSMRQAAAKGSSQGM
jgi:hypothetical protein